MPTADTPGPKTKATARALIALVVITTLTGLVVFASAGTAHYWQAWGYLGVYFVPSLIITIYLAKHDPALLERRLRGGPTAEKQKAQKVSMLLTGMAFLSLFVVSGLDHRFGWTRAPVIVAIAGDALMVLGFSLLFLVARANPFASATIEVADDQKVISTGPYAVVRHPLYAGSLPYLVGTPLALGSYWGLLGVAAMLLFLVWRLLDEERVLSSSLPGYVDYCRKVRWRLLPGVF